MKELLVVKSEVLLVGDVVKIDEASRYVKVVTRNGEYSDEHPVAIPQSIDLSKIKLDRKIGFKKGIVMRVNGATRKDDRTVLVANPATLELTQKVLNEVGYLNQVTISGPVSRANLWAADLNKQPMFNMGIGPRNVDRAAIWATIFRNAALEWDAATRGSYFDVFIKGWMRSRERSDGGGTMYEINVNPSTSTYTNVRPIATEIEQSDEMREMYGMAFNTPGLEERSGSAAAAAADDDAEPF